MKKVQALIITGYGINCEKEMALACELTGAEATIVHAHALISGEVDLGHYDLLGFPGGFSFGDDLGAGKAFANRISHSSRDSVETLRRRLERFVDGGKCILGICNGFQLLVKLGLLPFAGGNSQSLSLTYNDSRKFEDRWVRHRVNPTKCVFTRGIEHLYLPVRHGEGKLIGKDKNAVGALFDHDLVVLQYSDAGGAATEQYPDNPNGSAESVAGICDPSGRIFGMMAHPEAALFFTNTPDWHRVKDAARRKQAAVPEHGDGFQIFKNAITYLEESR